jgi:hypothetical protein
VGGKKKRKKKSQSQIGVYRKMGKKIIGHQPQTKLISTTTA